MFLEKDSWQFGQQQVFDTFRLSDLSRSLDLCMETCVYISCHIEVQFQMITLTFMMRHLPDVQGCETLVSERDK